MIAAIIIQLVKTFQGVTTALATLETQAMHFLAQVSIL